MTGTSAPRGTAVGFSGVTRSHGAVRTVAGLPAVAVPAARLALFGGYAVYAYRRAARSVRGTA